MKGYKFNLSITEKCNLACPHCYTRNRTDSLRPEQINTIVENLADGCSRVKLEGGEAYCERELLYHTIRRFRERFPNAEIRINTNGVSFYDNKETILREADRLYSLGVRRIRLSLDKFHEEGGANLIKVASIKEILETQEHPLEVGFLSLAQAFAIGRAEDLPEEQKERVNCKNDQSCVENPYFFTDVHGNVYICGWKIIPPLGNLLKSRLIDL
jgi:hypothetical protein